MTTKELEAPSKDKIEEMSLDALKKYACPRYAHQKDWYKNCEGCNGLNLCKTGKRVLELTKARPKYYIDKNYEHSAQKYIEAISKKDPVGYLLSKGYFEKKWIAQQNLNDWLNSHNIPKGVQLSREDFVFGSPPDKTAVAVATRSDLANQRADKFFSGAKEPIDLIRKAAEEEPGTLAKTIYSRWYGWYTKLPGIHEKYSNIAPETYNLVKRLSRNTPEMTIKELYEKLTAGDTDGDEVGAADLLQELLAENKPATDSKKPKEFVKAYESKAEKAASDTEKAVYNEKNGHWSFEEKPITPKEANEHAVASIDVPKKGDPVATTPIPSEGQLAIQKEFGRKRIELKARINKLDELIALYTKQKNEAMDQIRLLDQTAMLFGMKAIKEFDCGSQQKQTL
jgi:hypothetical protein